MVVVFFPLFDVEEFNGNSDSNCGFVREIVYEVAYVERSMGLKS